MAVLRFSEFQAVNRHDPLDLPLSGLIDDTMSLINKVMLPLFFTPFATITSLFTRNGWLILVNSVVALGNIFSNLLSYLEGTIYSFDFLISLSLMGGCIFLAVSATPNFFPLIYNFNNIFFALNLISTAINASYLIKDLVIFAVKQVLEFFNIKLTSLFVIQPLDIKNNKTMLKNIIFKAFIEDKSQVNSLTFQLSDSDILRVNNLLNILRQYIDDYTLSFLGAVVNKRKIDSVKKLLSALYLSGHIGNVIQFVEYEFQYKAEEINNLKEVYEKMSFACQSESNLDEYNTLMLQYFSEVQKLDNVELLSESFKCLSELLKEHMRPLVDECVKFEEALPPHSKIIKDYNEIKKQLPI